MNARNLSIALCLAALASGCRTDAMKGTPFFSGEFSKRVGPAEDRVNLWPLVYWRDPALSVLWPVGEWADDRFAVRPLFSLYRSDPDGPYDQTNVLWPLMSFDEASDDYWVFPYFWGSIPGGGSYSVLFPFWWNRDDPRAGLGSNGLFPLWMHFWNDAAESESWWAPFPLVYRKTGKDVDAVDVFPFYSRERKFGENGETVYKRDAALLGLAGRTEERSFSSDWFAPFWYHDVRRSPEGPRERLFTLLWCGVLEGDPDDDWWCSPLLLSGGWEEGGGSSWTVLAGGLAGWNSRESGTGSHWVLPFYVSTRGEFYSLLWSGESGPGGWWSVPLLLSGGRTYGDGSGSDALLLGGLAGWDDARDRNWLFPLWFSGREDFLTPLWGHWTDREWKTGAEIVNRYWFTPLFGTRSGARSGSWLFPIYEWSDSPGGDYDLDYLVLGNARRRGAKRSSGFFPLYSFSGDDKLDELSAHMESAVLPDSALPPPYLGGDAWEWERRGFDSAATETRFLLGAAGSERTVRRLGGVAVARDGDDGKPVWQVPSRPDWGAMPADSADKGATNAVVVYQEASSGWFFPVWDSEELRHVFFDAETGEKVSENVRSESSVLFFLWDDKVEDDSRDGHHYERTRVLWRLYHDEELDGDRSIDVFPGIGIDNKKNGYHKTSVLWRLFRYEDDPDKGVSLDLLFIPILRP